MAKKKPAKSTKDTAKPEQATFDFPKAAMRSIWSGALSFGLINVPVKLYSGSEDRELKFHFLHKTDLSPIKYARICQAEGREVPYEDIVRGYEYAKGNFVVLTDEDLEKANVRKMKTIEILDFVDANDIDPIYFEKPYFLEPDRGAEKPYALLREALARSKKVGVAKFVIRNREHIGALKAFGRALLLDQLKYQAELRSPETLNLPTAEVGARELEMALRLIEELSSSFKPANYKDTYTEDLKQVIRQKAKGKVVKPKGKEPAPTGVDDLMAVLRASLERERKKAAATHK